uniref:Uncharacterized protein n=1 Tax=Rhizophagus irregularis (strain DAOM 181602 / DAOM 197198 / MUCL 43194) TaxID=747089 RepID=U9U427_RHIID
MAQKSPLFFKQCKDYVRGITRARKKITRKTVRKGTERKTKKSRESFLKQLKELDKQNQDWIAKLRSVVLRKMNERDQEFKSWCEVAEILSLEVDNKVLCKETGKPNEQICTKLLVNVLKDFDLTISDFDQLLLMYDESISKFQNKKTTLKDLPYVKVELARHPFQTKKCNSEENKPKGRLYWVVSSSPYSAFATRLRDYTTFWTTYTFNTGHFHCLLRSFFVDKPLKELERQDETEK